MSEDATYTAESASFTAAPLAYCACEHNTLSDAGVRALQAGYVDAVHAGRIGS